jgi:hypothetical protein
MFHGACSMGLGAGVTKGAVPSYDREAIAAL